MLEWLKKLFKHDITMVYCRGHWFTKGETIKLDKTMSSYNGFYKIVRIEKDRLYIRRKLWQNLMYQEH